MREKIEESVTWKSIQNWWPVIGAAIALSYWMAVLTIKIDNVLVLLEQHEAKQERLIADLNQVHRDLTLLEAIHPGNRH